MTSTVSTWIRPSRSGFRPYFTSVIGVRSSVARIRPCAIASRSRTSPPASSRSEGSGTSALNRSIMGPSESGSVTGVLGSHAPSRNGPNDGPLPSSHSIATRTRRSRDKRFPTIAPTFRACASSSSGLTFYTSSPLAGGDRGDHTDPTHEFLHPQAWSRIRLHSVPSSLAWAKNADERSDGPAVGKESHYRQPHQRPNRHRQHRRRRLNPRISGRLSYIRLVRKRRRW